MFGFSPFASSGFSDLQDSVRQNVELAGLSATTALGNAVVPAQDVPVTGVAATTALGTVTTSGDCNVFPVSVVAVGNVTRVLVWGQIDDSQTPNWQAVNDTQASGWTPVNDNQTTTWSEILQ